jgi:hypothetical protein
MSFVDSEHEKSYVITYKELIFTLVVFCVILFVLYPKDLLKEQILSEKSNYDLSMLYLNNLLQHDPENESLMLILAEQSLRSGKKDLSLRLLELLLQSENVENRNRATLLSYELNKEDYYYLQDEKQKAKQKTKLRELFLTIVSKEMYTENQIDQWYNESIFLSEDRAMYFFLQKKLLLEPTNVELLENAYYLSIKLHKTRDSQKYIGLLAKYDPERKNKWVIDEYYMLLNYKKYAQAEKLLMVHANDSFRWKNRLAEFYLLQQEYTKASNVYIELSKESSAYREKRDYFYKAVRALQSGNRLYESARLAKRYEAYYMNDPEVRKFLLKLYLATGSLDKASVLSKKILKREGDK